MRVRNVAFILAAAVLTVAAVAAAQEQKTVTVGPEYAAGGGHRYWLGDGYRDLWTTPVALPVLDLQREAGGLTPVRQVGQAQSVGLAMKGADGRSYTFRSLHKEPDRMLPEVLRDTFVGVIARDLTAGTNPAAGVIAPVLAEAAGVPHPSPRLVVMPDDPALGEFRATFANLIGTLEEYPLPAGGGNPGFMGATEILPSTRMWTLWMEGPENRLDHLAYLRARVLDLWVDNYDRHRGQWRWMKLPGKDAWQPLPEDPDFVLVHRDGMVAKVIRTRVPQYLQFSEKYPKRLDGALLNSAEMDRWVLSGASRDDFEAVARDLQARFTDEVIDRALRQMPAEWYAQRGESLAAALRARRAGLVDYVLRVYHYYAKAVDVQATDRNERVTVARHDDGSIEVAIGLADGGGAPYFRRRFVPSETDEVRIFLRGGDDRVERTGPAGGDIAVRVIAGGGRDIVDDSKSGGTDVWRDAGTLDVDRGRGTHVRDKVWPNPVPVKDAPWIEPRSWGNWAVGLPVFGYAPDVNVYVGWGISRTSWGFRTLPSKSVQSIQGAISLGEGLGKVGYSGIFRRPASRFGYQVHAFGSGVESYNFFGLGNDTPEATDRSRYQTKESMVDVFPALRYELGNRFSAFVGPAMRFSRTPTDSGTIVAEQAPIGVGDFGLFAVRGGLTYDSRLSPVVAAKADYTKNEVGAGQAMGGVAGGGGPALGVSGIRIETSGFYVPKAWDVKSEYGGVDGEIAAYIGNARRHLALRVGGRSVWGDYAWFDAAVIGGSNSRGYRSDRFAGDSSLYGSASLRGWFGSVGLNVISLRLGGVVFSDVGRVWLAGEESNTWHASYGGGVLMQPVGLPITLNTTVGTGTEGLRWYFGFGYPF